MHAIYGIEIENKIYVGSAINYFQRIETHQRRLTNNCHPNQHLQNAWSKYNYCEFKILEEVDNKIDLLSREEFWIEKLKSYDREFGYNKRRKPNSNLGLKFSEEIRKKQSIAHKARKRAPHSLETIEKIRKANTGKIQSLESNQKRSIATKGKPKSIEHKTKIGSGNRKVGKWPHDAGAWCKCRECLDKKNEMDRNRKLNKAKNNE